MNLHTFVIDNPERWKEKAKRKEDKTCKKSIERKIVGENSIVFIAMPFLEAKVRSMDESETTFA